MPNFNKIVLGLALAASLAACGGGSDDPDNTDRFATLRVSAATNSALVGDYSSDNVGLSDVERVNPIDQQCRFRFDNLRKDDLAMSGDIRYEPDADRLEVIYISISGKEFSTAETRETGVNREDDEVTFPSTVMRATDGSTDTITVGGTLPMRRFRSAGC